MDKINFREMFADGINGSSEAVDFIIKFCEEHQAKGDISDADLLSQSAKHLAQDSNWQKTREVIRLNDQVADGINTLNNMGKWTSLSRIADHALESCIECLENDNGVEKPWADMIKGMKIRQAIMKMGSDNFKNVFTKEFLDTFA